MLSKPISSHISSFLIISSVSLFAFDANAHEFWIEPLKFEIEIGSNIEANFRNGQDFKGAAFPYVKQEIDLYTITNSGESVSPKQRTGNSPAFDFKTKNEGLHIASYQGKFDTLDFKKWSKFTHYVENQGYSDFIKRHKTRGLPKTGFQEQYARCAKALIQVGNGFDGSDTLTGLKYELVANKNPYSLSQNDSMPVTLYYEGKPAAGKQIQVFRDDGTKPVKNFKLITDENGKAIIPLEGGGKFMLNSVYLYEGDTDPNTKLPEYQSYWATLTFGIIGTDAIFDN